MKRGILLLLVACIPATISAATPSVLRGRTGCSLNRYKEKCFLIMPLMRELRRQGKLTGPSLDLMERHGPCEELYDTETDPHEISNLIDSPKPEHRDTLLRLRTALDTWITETGDRYAFPEPPGVVAPFAREMHDWLGTPAWAQDLLQTR